MSIMGSKLRLEKTLLVLVILTVLAIVGRDWVLHETYVIEPAQGFDVRLYSDAPAGGNTETTLLKRQGEAYHWRCKLKTAYQYPHCGFEVRLTEDRARGLDFSHYQTMRLWLDYEGPGETVRVFLRNYNSLYSSVSDDTTTKYNQVEFKAAASDGYYEFGLNDFFVANWWLVEKEVSPQLSHPEFSNVVSFEIQTGSSHAPGEYRFALRRVELVGQRFDTADWYLGIMLVWATLILGFLIYRVAILTGEVRERKARERELMEVNAVLDTHSRELETQAKTDALTGAFNRKGIEDAVRAGLWDWRANDKPLSIVMMDIDHFKAVNDQYGHAAGDEVLASISALVKDHVRNTDLFARWGGEEFVLVCRNTRISYAAHIAEKLRSLISEQDFGEVGSLTASFGVATLAGGIGIEQLFKAADDALYRAKERGRNRVEVAE